MDERKEFRAWCESLTESDWLIAQSFEESFFLGAWAAWRHLRTALAAATERAEAAEGYIAKIEAIRGKKLGVPCCCDFADDDGETPIVECGYHRAVREERDAANARADALAARLAEVEDREHPQ